MASPRGQNQEGSQMEEENRSQEEETETSAVKWGMVVGSNVRTWEGSACAPGALAKQFFTKQVWEGSEITRTPRRSGRYRRGNSRPSLLGVMHRGPTR